MSDSFELIYHDLNIENNRELSEDQWLEIITDPAHIGLAKLILDRQKQRIATKQKYKVDPIEGWEY